MIRDVDSSGVPAPAPPGIQVIRRAAAVLAAVGDRNGDLRLGELDDLVGLAKTTTHRIVGALADEDLLRVDGQGRIWIGPAVSRLAGSATAGLVDQHRPVLADLHAALDETVDLSVRDGDRVRFIDQVQSTRPLRVVSAVGAAFPLHCTANGKALLAAMDRDRVDRLLPPTLERSTPNTIVDRERLHAELDEVRRSGVAEDREEHTEGIAAVGVALGPDVAVSVPVPASRYGEVRAAVVDALLAVRDATNRASR